MEENQTHELTDTTKIEAISEKEEKTTHAINRETKKSSAFRNIILTTLQISNIAFCVSLGYLFVTFLLSSLGVNMSPFFGGMINGITLGFSATIGFFYYVAIFLIGATIVALMIGFISINNKYAKILREANRQDIDIFILPSQTISCIFSLILVSGLLGFLSLAFIFNNMFSLPIVALIVATVALIIAFVFILVYVIKNRKKFNNLSDIDKVVVKEQSKNLITAREKREKKKRVGKLY